MSAYFDQSAVDRVLQFVRLLTLTKCTKSGQPEPFEPLPWFQKLIANVYGWRKQDGSRMVRRCFASMARKNAKTQCIAALGLVEFLGVEPEGQPEVYLCAKSIEQAGYCYSAARDMVRADPDLDGICDVKDSTKTILNRVNGGVLKVLSAEGKSKHGSNPSCVIFDELHAWGSTEQELYDALTSGSVARRQPLFLMITTAGHDLETLCGREYLYAKRVLDGTAQDESYFPLIYELPREADWTDESLWPLANPGLGVTVQVDALRQEVKTALARPAEQNKVRRLNFNQWTETDTIWIPPAEWDGCAAAEWPDLRGVPCYGGLDLSMTRDLSAFSLVWPVGDVTYTRTWFWLPQADMQDRIKRDGVRYDLWTPKWLEMTPGDVVDYRYLVGKILDLSHEFNIQCVAYDRWGAEPIRQALEGEGVKVMQFGQGYSSMNAPSQQLENMVFGRKIQHDENPVMRWNFSCCSKMEDPAGNCKPVKAKGSSSSQRIDGVVALTMAIGASMGAERPIPVCLIGAV